MLKKLKRIQCANYCRNKQIVLIAMTIFCTWDRLVPISKNITIAAKAEVVWLEFFVEIKPREMLKLLCFL